MAANKHTPERRSSKDKLCHTRTLKVRQGSYSRMIQDKHHARFNRTVHTTVPWINIQGLWLERAGFKVHAPLRVRVMPGCLVITVEE